MATKTAVPSALVDIVKALASVFDEAFTACAQLEDAAAEIEELTEALVAEADANLSRADLEFLLEMVTDLRSASHSPCIGYGLSIHTWDSETIAQAVVEVEGKHRLRV